MKPIYKEEENEKGFDFKRYLSKLGKNYYWFFIGIVLFSVGAFFYLQYTPSLYSVTTNVLVKQPNETASKIGSAFGSSNTTLDNAASDFSNEILKFKSASVVGLVVDSLQLNIKLAAIQDKEHVPVSLNTAPFTISVNTVDPEKESPLYKLTLYQTYYKIESNNSKAESIYGKPLQWNGDSITLFKKEPFLLSPEAQYDLQILGRTNVITSYISRLKVEEAPKAGPGMLQVSLLDDVPDRGMKIINVLVYEYDVANLSYNNRVLWKELNFLNDRLVTATDELEAQEEKVKDFKANNHLFDVSSSANQLLATLPLIDSKKTDNLLKSDLLNLVEKNIKSYNGNEDVVMNNNGLQDAVLGDQINKYNQLVLQKKTVLENGTNLDPRLASINGQLAEMRSSILKNIKNIRNEIQANSNSLAMQERTITGRFSSIPEKEKELIELNRVLDVKQSLYNFLLQKREDKRMEIASTEIAQSRIIDNDLNGATKVPRPMMFYAVALGAGILIPALIILVRLLINKKIETRQEIETLTALPIVGEIGNLQKGNVEIVVTPENISPEAEQFRTLRTNISYLTLGAKNKTLLVTSSKSNEGKSFISLNLANSIAITNKKVVLLEFDLRNPTLSKKMSIKETLGISNFLNGEVSLQEIIQPIEGSGNLFFISCGSPLPSNPGELILNERMQELFEFLKSHFDAVVIDTPPVGPVSDALILSRWADVSFFVIRHKYTFRSAINLLNKLSDEKKLPNLTLIMNGIKDTKEFNYGNDYSYGYGYGYENSKKRKRKEATY